MIQVNRVRRFLYGSVWALMPDKLAEMAEFIEAHARGERLTREEVAERIGPAPRVKTQAPTGGAIAVIPLMGVLTQRANIMSEISGGTSTQMAAAAVRAAARDASVASILLEIDSPGGETYGTGELADVVYAATQQKRVTALVNSMAASAAYWVASQASEVFVTPGGDVGSIGVMTVHQEQSRKLEAEGVTTTIVRAGDYKAETNSMEPLTAAARAELQNRVDIQYGRFVAAVARGRQTTAGAVRAGFGRGRLVSADEAVRSGMADGIKTVEQTVDYLAHLQPSRGLRAFESHPGAALSVTGATGTGGGFSIQFLEQFLTLTE